MLSPFSFTDRRSMASLIWILGWPSAIIAADYYVSPAGNDANSGSIEAPFRTLAHAAQFPQAGDTLYLRAGVYQEKLVPRNSGTAGNPVIYRAFPGEEVVITAMESLNGWELDAGSVYRTTVDWDLEQRNLIMHGQDTLDLARWPNNEDGDVWTLDSLRNTGGSGENVITGAFLDYAPGIPDHDWSEGGSIFFYGDRPGSGWTTWRAFITRHTSTRVNFELDKNPAWIRTAHPPVDGGEFFLEGTRKALDFANEWFFDSATNTLYVQLPGGGAPMDGAISMRRRVETIDLRDLSFVEIHDLKVFGGEILISGNSNRLYRVTSLYGNWTRGVVRGFHAASRSVHVMGNDHVIERCDIGFGAGSGIWDSGTNTLIRNCYVHDFNILGDYDAIVMIRDGGGGTRLVNNTLTRGGRDAIQIISPDSEVGYNDVSRSNLIADDCGLLYTLGGPKRIEIHHNWFHDTASHGDKFKAAGIYLDNDANGFEVHHNVVWNTEWSNVQINWDGTDINIYNNTFWNGSDVMGAWHKEGTAFSNVNVYNNVSNHDGWEEQADKQNNLTVTGAIPFIDSASGDFRLRAGSAPVDAGRIIRGVTDGHVGPAPDIGAYEHGGEFWIPGIDWDPVRGPVGFTDSKLVNLSVRTPLAEDQNLTVGFVTAGGAKELLIRAIGPGLVPHGVPENDVHPDPAFTLSDMGGEPRAMNDNWETIFPLGFPLMEGSLDAALVYPITGPYTAKIGGPGSGIVLLEAYDTEEFDHPAEISNLSARNQVGTGDRVLIAGFVLEGSTPRSLLIRGVGPTLRDTFNLPDVLTNPVMTVHDMNGNILDSNAKWAHTLTPLFDEIGAFQLTPGSDDAALRITLDPGLYTVQLKEVDQGEDEGEGLIEVYILP